MEKGLRLAICDDEQYVHDIVRGLLDDYTEEKGISYEMHHIYSAQELLSFQEEIDFLLLDIDMLTSKAERFKEAFKIRAFRFVTKPVFKEELFEAVDEVRERMIGRDRIQAYQDGVLHEIVQRDILYLMADGNAVQIFTERQEYRSEKPLREWAEELDERMFFDCHRSYIVNLGKIVEIEKDMAVMLTGEKVSIARRKRTRLQQSFMMFDARRR